MNWPFPKDWITPLQARKFKGRNEHVTLEMDGIDGPLEIKRNRRAKRMILRVDGKTGTPVLTLPPRSSQEEGLRFVQSKVGWIIAQQQLLGEAELFRDGCSFSLRGDVCHIEAVPKARGAAKYHDGILKVPGDVEGLSAKVTRYLKKEARADLSDAVNFYCRRAEVKAKRLSIRDTRSRWGSCSSNGVLSFSWRLVLAPPNVLTYVAAHEVAHLREMNHGPEFWALVKELDPEYENARRWLKKNGARLHRIG